jgi:hypothetical protein
MWLRELLAGLIFQSRFDKSRAIRGNEGVVITNLTKPFRLRCAGAAFCWGFAIKMLEKPGKD